MKLSLETGLNLFHGSYLLLSCSNLFAIMFLGAFVGLFGICGIVACMAGAYVGVATSKDELCGFNYGRKLIGPLT